MSVSEIELDPYDNTKYKKASEDRSKEDREEDFGTPDDIKPHDDDESSGGSGWVIFIILLLLVASAGALLWVKHRKEMGMPLNPFAKDYSFAAGYGAGEETEGMKASIK